MTVLKYRISGIGAREYVLFFSYNHIPVRQFGGLVLNERNTGVHMPQDSKNVVFLYKASINKPHEKNLCYNSLPYGLHAGIGSENGVEL